MIIINKVLCFFFILIYSLSSYETINEEVLISSPQEEYFRYRNELSFNFNGFNQEQISFIDIHNKLRELERNFTNEYIGKIDYLSGILGINEDLEKSMKRKNIAVFGVTLLYNNNNDIRKVSFIESKKAFISGERLPFFNRRGGREVISFLPNNNTFLSSLEESTNNYNSEDIEKYINEDLFKGFFIGKQNERKKYYGIFGKENNILPSYVPIASKIDDFFDNNGRFSRQGEGWAASLVDSEQSLRIYFQEKFRNILEEILSEKPSNLPSPSEEVLGVMLHIHSRMDVCELCNASLVQMMHVCNRYYKQGGVIDGYRSFLNDQFCNEFHKNNIQMSPQFRFRVTVSSREPYVKFARVFRRNWCGRDDRQIQPLQSIEHINFDGEDYIVAHAYQNN